MLKRGRNSQLYGFLVDDYDDNENEDNENALVEDDDGDYDEQLPAQLEFQPMILDQLVKEVDVRLGDDGDDDDATADDIKRANNNCTEHLCETAKQVVIQV